MEQGIEFVDATLKRVQRLRYSTNPLEIKSFLRLPKESSACCSASKISEAEAVHRCYDVLRGADLRANDGVGTAQLGYEVRMTNTMDPAPLGRIEAIWDALRSHSIDFYPKVMVDGAPQLLTSHEIIDEFGKASDHWTKLTADDELNDALQLARDSLDEVKSQTEYQDQKATRLLTVTTFVTALSAALFARLVDGFPFGKIIEKPWWMIFLIGAAYGMFSIFLMYSLCGALVTFHATRTRFKYRKHSHVSVETGPAPSRLFYQGIIKVRPSIWSLEFVGPKPASDTDTPKLSPRLKANYLADMVGETYLIACKTADKLRYLDPAQRLLATALKCLIAWILLLALLAVLQQEKISPPTAVKVVPSDAPIAVDANIATMPSLSVTTTASPTPEPPANTVSESEAATNAQSPLENKR